MMPRLRSAAGRMDPKPIYTFDSPEEPSAFMDIYWMPPPRRMFTRLAMTHDHPTVAPTDQAAAEADAEPELSEA